MNSSRKPKFDWYQTNQYVVVNILVKNMNPERVTITFESNRMTFYYTETDDDEAPYKLELSLSGTILPNQCNYRIGTVKAEIKMKKDPEFWWSTLEAVPGETSAPVMKSTEATTSCSIADRTKTWDELIKQVEKEEEEENGIESMFRKMYADGDENLKRAMNKSFVESKGTVLNTNWNDVSKGEVSVRPPK